MKAKHIDKCIAKYLFPPKSEYAELIGGSSQFFFSFSTRKEIWRMTESFPAYRRSAKFRKLLLRLLTLAPFLRKMEAHSSDRWVLQPFADLLDVNVARVVVLVGTLGPEHKTIVELWDERGHICGYIKLGLSERAQHSVKKEYSLLQKLPVGLAAKPIALQDLDIGVGMLLEPVVGRKVDPYLPAEKEAVSYLDDLVLEEKYAFEDHPWIKSLLLRGTELDRDIVKPLSDRQWPVTIVHGDYAPWNIIIDTNYRVSTVDWEHGSLQGFPFYDLIYYILQVSFLMYRWTEEDTVRYAKQYLSKLKGSHLNSDECFALIRLSAYAMYKSALEEGQPESSPRLVWCKKIWQMKK